MNMEDLDKRLENILNNQEKINADIEELNTLVEELKREELEQDKTPIGWKPEEGENYYFANANGKIVQLCNNTEFDTKVIKHTRVFKTRKEAEFEAERMKVMRELEKFAGEFVEDEYKWCICWDWEENSIDTDYSLRFTYAELYFETMEKAKQAIKAVGEDRVKKYYLGVTN